jgi:two-component system response regulator YesN
MSKPSVLFVDDEVELVEIYTDMFEFDEIEILSANSGKDALKVIEENNVSIIISDIKMPNGSGIELLKALNEKKLNIPAILVTGFTEFTNQELIDLGAIELLHKPVDYERLKHLIFENV